MGKKPQPVSPLAPAGLPSLPVLPGLALAAGEANIRYAGRPDLILARLGEGSTVAGVLTLSKTASAPVRWCRAGLKRGRARGLVVNAGNANAFTGKGGEDVVRRTAAAAAKLIGCKPREIFVASTGVIGEPLPVERIEAALPALAKALSPDAMAACARAIMTTDTFPKASVRTAEIGGVPVTIAGFCKGAGMIQPNMGTTLSFIFTDATLPAEVLRPLVSRAADRSFNCITIDSDTSTSDTCLVFATGAGARHPRIVRAGDPRLKGFRAALESLMTDLAQQIVRDGEGATRLVEIRVSGAKSARSARALGFAVANSPLVKTAVAGGDPNWGRIVMALGKVGEPLDQARLAIKIGGQKVARAGARHPDYDEARAAEHMKGQEILFEIALGVGPGAATVWTCDLTHAYIDINADYRS
jgi:glutamate N-acetyltransferase/amino-acid N-acetyltransferase